MKWKLLFKTSHNFFYKNTFSLSLYLTFGMDIIHGWGPLEKRCFDKIYYRKHQFLWKLKL